MSDEPLPEPSAAPENVNAPAKQRILPWEEENPTEPLPVPRKNLYWLAGLCGMLVLSVFVPVELSPSAGWFSSSLLGHGIEALSKVGSEFLLFGFCLIPGAAAAVSTVIALHLGRSVNIMFAPRGMGILAAIFSVFPILWILVLTLILILLPRARDDYGAFIFMYAALLPAVVAFFLRSHRLSRSVVAIIAAGSVNLAVVGGLTILLHRVFWLFPLFGFIALAVIILGFQVLFVYRRQRRLEVAFERVMRARER